MKSLLTGCGKSSQGAAVKGIFQRDYLIRTAFLTVFTRYLDGALVGLSPRVAEKCLGHTGGLTEFLCQSSILRRVIVVANMLYLPRLLRNCLCPTGVTVAKTVYPYP